MRTLIILLAGPLLALNAPDSLAEPFKTRDQNPLTTIYGQPLPVGGALPAVSTHNYTVSLDISNSINNEEIAAESVFLDYESYALTLSLDYGLNEHWALRLELPLLYRGSGMFDQFIDQWHAFWGLPRGIRPDYPQDQFEMRYNTQFDYREESAGIGDVQLGAGYQLHKRGRSAVSLWASLDLPTGQEADLTGNGSTDFSLMLAASHRGTVFSNSLNAGVVLPGSSMVSGLETETAVLFGHIHGGWDVNDIIELKLQLAGHSGYYSNTDLETLGPAVVLVFGGRIKTSPCSGFDIGFSEDIKVNASPDISFLLSWSSTTGDCRQ